MKGRIGVEHTVGRAAVRLEAAREVRDVGDEPLIAPLLNSLAAEGRTVFVSSHLLPEMAQTAQDLVVIGRGRLIYQGTMDDFVARTSEHGVRVRTPHATTVIISPAGPRLPAATRTVRVPGTIPEIYTPIPYIVPGQLFAAHLAAVLEVDDVLRVREALATVGRPHDEVLVLAQLAGLPGSSVLAVHEGHVERAVRGDPGCRRLVLVADTGGSVGLERAVRRVAA